MVEDLAEEITYSNIDTLLDELEDADASGVDKKEAEYIRDFHGKMDKMKNKNEERN